MRIDQLTKDGQRMRTQQRNGSEKKKLACESKILVTKDKIVEEAKKYISMVEEDKNNADAIKNAFVVFRSQEGAARMIQAYNHSSLSVCCTSRSCCETASKRRYRKKLFHGNWLKVDEAVEPALINWENLGLSAKARCVRISFLTIVSILLLILTTFGILYAKVQENELKQDAVVCTVDKIERADAYADIKLPEEEQTNLMWCYCRSVMWAAVNKKENPYTELAKPFDAAG